jgi:predicted dehydrogenase
MASRLRVGVIGAGRMNQRAHIPNLLAENCEIPAIADPRFETTKLVANAFGIETAYGFCQDLLARDDIDAVVVAVPDQLHASIAVEALESGKHVFLEKPMATNSLDAQKVVDAARETGRKLSVAYQRRHDPAAELTKRLMSEFSESGEMGAARTMEWRNYGGDWLWTVDPLIQASDDPPQEPLDPRRPAWLPQELWGEFDIFNNGLSHGVDLMQYLMGDATSVLAAYPRYHAGTMVILDWNGVRTLIAGAPSEGSMWQEWFEVRYERGWLRFATPPALHSNQPGHVSVYRGGKGVVEHYDPPHEWAFRRELQHFLRCVRENSPESPTPDEARRTLRTIEAIFQKAAMEQLSLPIEF